LVLALPRFAAMLVIAMSVAYAAHDFGRAENRFRRKPGEESPNSAGRDAA